MKQLKSLAAIALLIAATSQTQVFGLTLTQSATAPTTGVTLSQTGTGTPSIWSNTTATVGGGTPSIGSGETFQVFAAQTGTGYFNAAELTSITIKNTVATTSASLGWTLKIGQVTGYGNSPAFSNGTFSVLDTETISSALVANREYITFTLSNYVALTAGNVYMFNLSTTGGSINLDSTNLTTYTGGLTGPTGRASIVNASNAVSNSGSGSGARTFFLTTTPVPEPSTWAIVPVLGTLAFLGYRRFRAVASV